MEWPCEDLKDKAQLLEAIAAARREEALCQEEINEALQMVATYQQRLDIARRRLQQLLNQAARLPTEDKNDL